MSDAPRRLHPGTILVDFLKSGPSTLVGLPAVLAFGTEIGALRVLLLTLAGMAVLALFTWLGWRQFTYTLTHDELVIARGLLQRSRRSIPLDRVQDVSIERGPLHRLLGLALVRVETGGGEADEARLDSVSLREAHRLRGELRGLELALSGEDAAPEQAPAIFAMSPGRVLLFGLFNFSLVWIAAIWGAVQSLDQFVDLDLSYLLGIAEREVRGHLTVAAVLAAVLVALTLGIVAGVVRTFLSEWGFRLEDGGARFRRTRGLLTRSEVVVVKSRIQAALVRRPPVRGRLGWQALELQTLGGSDDTSGRQQVAPFARAGEVAAVVHAAMLPPFERAALRQVAAGHVLRAVLRHGTPVLVVFGVAGFFLPPLWFGLALLPVPVGAALLQRRYHLYALRETSLQVARGVLSQRDWIVPYHAVQSVTVRRTWLQRRLGVATVLADTAGARGMHRPEVADIAGPDAAALATALIDRAS